MSSETILMNTANGDGIKLLKYEEIIFLNVNLVDPVLGAKFTKDMQYKEGDIVLCTYPKSGTHWICNTIWKLKSVDATDRPADNVLELASPAYYDNQNYPRIISSHQRPSRLNLRNIANNKGKIVLLLRNPKDVMVSLYYHCKTAKMLKNQQTWGEFFQSSIKGEVPFGSIFCYLQEWDAFLKEVSDDNDGFPIEVFYYEDFKSNHKTNLKRLNKVLGFDRDEQYLDRVLEETTLDCLRSYYNSDKKAMQNLFCTDEAGKSIIFRKGVVGDWKNHFKVAQSELVDTMLEESLKHGTIKFRFEI